MGQILLFLPSNKEKAEEAKKILEEARAGSAKILLTSSVLVSRGKCKRKV